MINIIIIIIITIIIIYIYIIYYIYYIYILYILYIYIYILIMHGELAITAIHIWHWPCHRRNRRNRRVAAPCWFSMPCCGSAGGHIPGCCCSSFGHGKGVGRKLAAPALEATAKYLRARWVGICKRLQGSESLKESRFAPRIASPCPKSQKSRQKRQRTRPETSR